MLRGLYSALSICFAICLIANGALAQTAPPEGVRVRELGPMQPHWVFLISPAGLDSEQATKVEVVDGDSLQLLGMLTGGMLGPETSWFVFVVIALLFLFFSRLYPSPSPNATS